MAFVNLTGDGTTDNYSALAAANAAGETVIVIDGVLRVAQNITMTVPMQFMSNASLKADGCTVTFNDKVDGPFQHIFQYVNSGLVVFTNKQKCPAEWWGSYPDNSTDCYAPIMAGLASSGNVILRAGTYYTSSTITIQSYQNLEGAHWRNTSLTSNSATLHIVRLGPISGYTAGTESTYANSPRIADLTVTRSVTPTSPATAFDISGATGVRVLGCNGFVIENVISENSNIGFYFGSTNGGHVTRPYSARSLGSSTDSYIGFYIDGLSTDGSVESPNASLRLTDPVVSNSITNNKVAEGFYINGHFGDVWLFRPETSRMYRSIHMEGTGSNSDLACNDVHIIQPVNSNFYNNGMFLNNFSYNTQVNIYGGNSQPHSAANSGNACVYIQSCNDAGITFSDGHECWGTYLSGVTGVLLNSSSGVTGDFDIKDCSIPVQIWGLKESRLTGVIRNTNFTATDAIVMDAATGPIITERNFFQFSIRGASGKITNGYKLNQSIAACSKNEFNCTMVDAGSVTNKINNNGTAITSSGIFGANGNLASGVMN